VVIRGTRTNQISGWLTQAVGEPILEQSSRPLSRMRSNPRNASPHHSTIVSGPSTNAKLPLDIKYYRYLQKHFTISGHISPPGSPGGAWDACTNDLGIAQIDITTKSESVPSGKGNVKQEALSFIVTANPHKVSNIIAAVCNLFDPWPTFTVGNTFTNSDLRRRKNMEGPALGHAEGRKESATLCPVSRVASMSGPVQDAEPSVVEVNSPHKGR
jgi:hypothetical protein